MQTVLNQKPSYLLKGGLAFFIKGEEEIMKKLITFSLTIFIISCATGPPTQILDNGFISSRPDFQVQFHKPIVEKSEKSRRVQRGDIKTYMFDVNYREGIVIAISTFVPDRSGFFLYGPNKS